ncbi:hypothetical protein LTR65_007458 [Meristemomyces frigidus]
MSKEEINVSWAPEAGHVGLTVEAAVKAVRAGRTKDDHPLIASSILLPLLGALLCYVLPRTNLASQLVGLYILYTYWAPYVTLVSVVSIYQANVAGYTKKTVLLAWLYVSWAVGNIIGPQIRAGVYGWDGSDARLLSRSHRIDHGVWGAVL